MRRLLLAPITALLVLLATPRYVYAQEIQAAKPLLVLPAGESLVTATAGGEPIHVFGRFIDSNTSVAVAVANSITIFSLEQGKGLRQVLTWEADERIGGMAAADVNGDGRDELATVTSEDGILDVQRFEKGARVPLGERRYLWSQVSSMASVRSTLGQLLVIALSDGTLFTYHWSGSSLEPLIADAQSLARGLRRLIPSDIDGDLQEELIVSNGSTQIAVLKLDKGVWVQSWQNYPWGGITGLTAGDVLGRGTPQLFVTTHERMGYVYEYGKRGLAMTAQLSDLPFGITSVSSSATPPPRPAVKVQSGKTGAPVTPPPPPASAQAATAARLLYASPVETVVKEGLTGNVTWRGRGLPTGNWTLWPDSGSGALPRPLALLSTPDGALTLYSLFDASSWRIRATSSDGTTQALLRDVSYRQGGVLVSARDVATLLAGKLTWDPEARVSRLTWPGGQVDVPVATGTALRNGEYVDAPPAETLGGKLYFPLLALERLFGWRVTWSVDESLIQLQY